jgi:hypothetical protein
VRGGFLVERDGVADVAGADVLGAGAGHQADLGEVPGGVAVRHAGEDRELLAVRLQDLQVAAGRVVAAGVFGEKVRGIHAQRPADQQHAAGLGLCLFGVRGAGGRHGVQQRQRNSDTRAAQQSASIKVHQFVLGVTAGM